MTIQMAYSEYAMFLMIIYRIIRRPQPSAGGARPRKSGLVATGCGCILGAAAWLQLPRGAFAGCILGAVAWLQLPRGAFAGGF